jgi:hypothetical protein
MRRPPRAFTRPRTCNGMAGAMPIEAIRRMKPGNANLPAAAGGSRDAIQENGVAGSDYRLKLRSPRSDELILAVSHPFKYCESSNLEGEPA